jgi:hypothetical protein
MPSINVMTVLSRRNQFLRNRENSPKARMIV